MAKNIHDYDDIINLPHHQSPTRHHMSNIDRAVQFSPFSALTGYDEAVKETARLTEGKMELDEDAKAALNEKLQFLLENGSGQQVSITYFKPDSKKAGGDYLSVIGNIRKINGQDRLLIMQNGTVIPLDDILEIQSDIFSDVGNGNE